MTDKNKMDEWLKDGSEKIKFPKLLQELRDWKPANIPRAEQEKAFNNSLIAEFMGVKYIVEYQTYQMIIDGVEQHKSPYEMIYHTSWNMLMPVVEKIEKMNHGNQGHSIIVTIGESGAYIGINQSNAAGQEYEGYRVIANTLNNNYYADIYHQRLSKIDGVYVAVVKFIQWYNKTKAA